MKLLICENEDVLLTALQFRLNKRNHTLILAKDGKEAAQYLLNSKPDIVITELNLPKTSGLELLRLAKTQVDPNLPFIIIADIEMADEILEILAEGARDFLLKPFKPDELLLRIEKIKQENK
ncbi:MAG: response regulator [Saprospiraceae bacterium]|nr:response regulator [Saprospiraceae bacterium]MCB9325087.1 response regulator [Lewinellaceae bacterium]